MIEENHLLLSLLKITIVNNIYFDVHSKEIINDDICKSNKHEFISQFVLNN